MTAKAAFRAAGSWLSHEKIMKGTIISAEEVYISHDDAAAADAPPLCLKSIGTSRACRQQRGKFVLSGIYSMRIVSVLLLAFFCASPSACLASGPEAAEVSLLPVSSATPSVILQTVKQAGFMSPSPFEPSTRPPPDDIGLSFALRVSEREELNVQLKGGLVNADRQTGDPRPGLSSAKLRWERKDGPVPFKALFGDISPTLSERTFNRSLKGMLVQLQPSLFGERTSHSLQIFGGTSAPSYLGMNADDEVYGGISWRMKNDLLGSLTLNGAYSNRQADAENDPAERSQGVTSLAYTRAFRINGETVSLESELAYCSGESAHDTGSGDDSDGGLGFFSQLRGMLGRVPLRYRLAYEQYGAGFLPNGTVVGADQRRTRGEIGLTLFTGLMTKGRYERHETSVSGANPAITNLYGINLQGSLLPMILQDCSLSADVFMESGEDRLGFFDISSRSAMVTLSKAFGSDYLAGAGLQYRQSRDRVARQKEIDQRLALSIRRSFAFAGLEGSLAPGLSLHRSVMADYEKKVVRPTLSLTLSKKAHHLSFSHNLPDQTPAPAGPPDSSTSLTLLKYFYTM